MPSLFLASTPDKDRVASHIHDQNQQFPDSFNTEWGKFAHDLKPVLSNGEILPDLKLNRISGISELDKGPTDILSPNLSNVTIAPITHQKKIRGQ